MNTEHATPELFGALALAQAEIENADKNAANPHFKNRYADLAEVLNTIRPVLSKHGLSVSQFPHFDGNLASVTTILAHKSGGYVSGVASCAVSKADAQGIGSATTYLRRYALAAVAGIAQEDDDGRQASAKVSDADQAKAADFEFAMKEAATIDALNGIASGIASMPESLKYGLRALYSKRKKELQA